MDVVGVDDQGGVRGVASDLVENNFGRRPGTDHDHVEVPGREQVLEGGPDHGGIPRSPVSRLTAIAPKAGDSQTTDGIGVTPASPGQGVEGHGVAGLAQRREHREGAEPPRSPVIDRHEGVEDEDRFGPLRLGPGLSPGIVSGDDPVLPGTETTLGSVSPFLDRLGPEGARRASSSAHLAANFRR